MVRVYTSFYDSMTQSRFAICADDGAAVAATVIFARSYAVSNRLFRSICSNIVVVVVVVFVGSVILQTSFTIHSSMVWQYQPIEIYRQKQKIASFVNKLFAERD